MEINHNFSSIQQAAGQYFNTGAKRVISKTEQNTESAFEKILLEKQKQAVGELKFSKHADNRLAQRNISLSEEQRKRLEDGTERARKKGIKESLVIDELAFIVSISNNTVITAMSQKESEDTIFTNIDGAVII